METALGGAQAAVPRSLGLGVAAARQAPTAPTAACRVYLQGSLLFVHVTPLLSALSW